ncbi:hypothetical protein [Natronomonas marina]|uniref:hypothetical protein n=1 Tax=Natronomonas marina TaxID=2961939 RepID=UPI0020C9B373|nr:hypothetical protein [Natronomonas marina]
MFRKFWTRRTVLKTIGAVGAAAAAPAVSAMPAEWTVEETPTDGDLHDVAYTSEGAYAVGNNGVVLERTQEGWRKVTDGGVTGDGRDLYGADVTDDGDRLWFVGASGAVGEYNVRTGNINDHGSPQDNTNNFLDVAVTGQAGEANVYVADGSGIVSYSFENGESGEWNSVGVGQGYALAGIDFYDVTSGHVINTNGNVFATIDGTSFDKIGIADSNGSFYGVDSDGPQDVWVAASGGVVYRYDGAWTKTVLGDPTLRDIDVADGTGYAVGESGHVFEYAGGAWTEETTETGQNLRAVDQGDPNVSVGDSSTVITD